jgi:hypothetical protein
MPPVRPTSPSGACARAQRNTALASYVAQRFTDHFRVAYRAWLAQGEPKGGPFRMKEYLPPGTTEAMAADQGTDSRFADALVFNQRGDNYTILTVLFALVAVLRGCIYSAGPSTRSMDLARPGDELSDCATVILATFPIDI